MNIHQLHTAERPWTAFQRIAFRISLLFFIIMAIPNSHRWYEQVFALNWFNLDYRDLYDICRFSSGITWFGNTTFGSRFQGYSIWVNTFFFALIAGLIWTIVLRLIKREERNYDQLFYWLNVIVRYRAGLGIIGFGFTKLFPVQMPYPSLGILDTDYGDLTAQKIFWLSFGIVPWYQVFAGILEVVAGAMLFFRKTTGIGAALLIGALGAIVVVNFAYDGGVHVYSSYFVLLSLFLLVPYYRPFYNLFVVEVPDQIKLYFPVLRPSFNYLRIALKAWVIFIFLGVLFYLQYVDYRYDPYKQPSSAGVKELRGHYQVTEFRLNGDSHPFDPNDSIRWQSATFEKWSTLTFRVNRALPLDLSNGGGSSKLDVNRTFEMTGVAGGQRAFHYYADTDKHTLYLEDKYRIYPDRNPSGTTAEPAITYADWIPDSIRPLFDQEVNYVHPRARTTRRIRSIEQGRKEAAKAIRERFVVNYQVFDDGQRVILSGIDENRDSLYVVLDKVDKDFKLTPGKLVPGQYD